MYVHQKVITAGPDLTYISFFICKNFENDHIFTLYNSSDMGSLMIIASLNDALLPSSIMVELDAKATSMPTVVYGKEQPNCSGLSVVSWKRNQTH